LKQNCCLPNKRIYALWIGFWIGFWMRQLSMQFLVDDSVDHDLFTLSLFIALPDY